MYMKLPISSFFIITSFKFINNSLDILNFVSLSNNPTRSCSSKLHHKFSSTNLINNSYLYRLPRICLPVINTSLPIQKILKTYFWNHFVNSFNVNNNCTLHYLCTCCKCSKVSCPVIYVLNMCFCMLSTCTVILNTIMNKMKLSTYKWTLGQHAATYLTDLGHMARKTNTLIIKLKLQLTYNKLRTVWVDFPFFYHRKFSAKQRLRHWPFHSEVL